MSFAYFGTGERQLFGALSRTKRLKARSVAVLLCNPFGEEAVRAHRSYRVLATQLAQLGFDVLRFDYSGTGDSMGDAGEVTVDRWLDDIDAAATQLRATTNGRAVVAVGLRLGGTLAALATSRRAVRLRHLVLWDPVVDGGAYLRALGAAHDEYMKSELGAAAWARRAPAPRDVPTEALGMPISSALAAQLRAIDLVAEEIAAEQTTVVSSSTDEPRLESLRERLAASRSTKWIAVTSNTPWNSDAVLNAQVVPMDIIEHIIHRIEECSP